MDTSLYFYELPNWIPQAFEQNVFRKEKKYIQDINSPLMSNPVVETEKKFNWREPFKKKDPTLYFYEFPN